jgi:hypothetical protein
MQQKWISLFLIISVLGGAVFAQQQFTDIGSPREVTNVGTAAATFLEIGVGARATALGGAFTAIADDPTTIFWNPAGVARLGGIGFTFNYADWIAGLDFSYVCAVASIGGLGGVGASVTYLNYGDQPVRTIFMPEGTGELYGANDFSMKLVVALNLTDRFSIGIGGKYIRQKIWNEQADGFALDLGILYTTPLKGLFLGGSISNFGTDMQLDGRDLLKPIDIDPINYNNDRINTKLKTDAFSLPLLFRFGISYRLLDNSTQNIILAADLLHSSNASETINLGAEYTIMRTFALRIGYDSMFQEETIKGLTLGGGVRVRQLRSFILTVDYVYKSFELFKNTNMISVGIKL